MRGAMGRRRAGAAARTLTGRTCTARRGGRSTDRRRGAPVDRRLRNLHNVRAGGRAVSGPVQWAGSHDGRAAAA